MGPSKRMTKADRERIDAIKAIGCIVCRKGAENRGEPVYPIACDAHHLKSGNLRRGHQYTVGLCCWHHRAVPFEFCSHADCRMAYGPSLAEGAKPFRAYCESIGIGDGSDDALLEYQNRLIGERARGVATADAFMGIFGLRRISGGS